MEIFKNLLSIIGGGRVSVGFLKKLMSELSLLDLDYLCYFGANFIHYILLYHSFSLVTY